LQGSILKVYRIDEAAEVAWGSFPDPSYIRLVVGVGTRDTFDEMRIAGILISDPLIHGVELRSKVSSKVLSKMKPPDLPFCGGGRDSRSAAVPGWAGSVNRGSFQSSSTKAEMVRSGIVSASAREYPRL
jgi:hypothetical protein